MSTYVLVCLVCLGWIKGGQERGAGGMEEKWKENSVALAKLQIVKIVNCYPIFFFKELFYLYKRVCSASCGKRSGGKRRSSSPSDPPLAGYKTRLLLLLLLPPEL